MRYTFVLSGENYKLAKFELEILLNRKVTRRNEIVSIDLDLSEKQIIEICHNSAMLQKCYVKDYKLWDSKTDKRFVERQPKKKIKFHPAMLKPKLARVLINLTAAKRKLLDPFCGTGSVLIEAGVLGLKPIGSDIERKMVWYSKLNTEHFKIKCDLHQLDATELEKHFKPNSIEAIACDPPYGKSSTLAGKKLNELYPKFLDSANKVLKLSCRLVMIRPDYLKLPINSKQWKKCGEFDWYVHGSLTRKILVLEKV
jgi:tRNA (guanine10-N2)-dimethyltransferase